MAQGHGAGAAASAAAHALVLAFVVLSPPVLYRSPPPAGGDRAIGVTLYTVAGENAATDAPLNEPMLGRSAASPSGGDTGGDAEPDGAQTEAASADASATQAAASDATARAEEPASAEREPAEALEHEPPAAQPDPAPEVLAAPGGSGAPVENPARPDPAPERTRPPVGPTGPDAADPVVTTQGAEAAAPVRRAQAPSFADIEARARDPIRPSNFTVQELEGLVRLAVLESFCLSSSTANLEAGECGDEPNPLSAELARYGLSKLGETYPTFLEDLSRIEFELQQLGANASTVDRILASMREARRQALEEPALTRRMREDEASRSTDNFGIGGLPPSQPDPSGGG